MKKLFDKYIAQSSRGQLISLAIAFSILVIAGGLVGKTVASADKGSNIYDFGRPETWGFMQCVDGGFVQATIRNNTEMTDDGQLKSPAPISVILLSLGFWLGGMVLVAFFTGAATDFLSARREKILSGDVDYCFGKDYVLIVGYDFQVKNLLRQLMTEKGSRERDIAVITDRDVDAIYADLLPELSASDKRRFYIMRKDIAIAESYAKLSIAGAREIYIIGDGDSVGRDGKTLQALERISQKAKCEDSADRRVKVYLHIEDPVLYTQVRAMRLPSDEIKMFDLEIYNYYESWAWQCWSAPSDSGMAYLPLKHRPKSKRVELFVVGAGSMGRAMVNFAMPLMNYGVDEKHCKITVFDSDPQREGFLPDRATLDALPEIAVEYKDVDGCSDAANSIMLEAAQRADTSVTIVIARSDPGEAIRAYAELANLLRRCEVSVLIWQATHSSNCPDVNYLRLGGEDFLSNSGKSPVADKTQVRYFGMTDALPWKRSERFAYGRAINYFYSKHVDTAYVNYTASPAGNDTSYCSKAKLDWDETEAVRLWSATPRWMKWSSINSGDTFREKSLTLSTGSKDALTTILHAEHNRWWTERLLAGWRFDPSVKGASGADKAMMLHRDMVPFDKLTPETQDKDKINIAAMIASGFFR